MNFSLEKALRIFGLQNIPEEAKAKLLYLFTDLASWRIFNRVLEIAVDDDPAREYLEQVQDEQLSEDHIQALAEYIPNIHDIIQEEIEQIRTEFSEVFSPQQI